MAKRNYFIAVPEYANNETYIRDNAILGCIEDINKNNSYEAMTVVFPSYYAGNEEAMASVKEAIGEYFSPFNNVNVTPENYITHLDGNSNIMRLTYIMECNKNRERTHIIILKRYMSPDSFYKLPGAIASVPQSNSQVPYPGPMTNKQDTIPGYIYKPKPKSSVPLVLNDKETDKLTSILDAIKNKDVIFDKYGLEEVLETRGVSFLFHGPSGTGKTQSAKYIASKTGKSLLIVDHSKILDKYVGETEKGIVAAFQYAKDNDCIIFFDEADSLLGKREGAERSWEVSKVNTLLQNIETFDGISIFATNFSDNLDSAMNRRILMKLEFGLPEEDSRAKLWQVLIPKKMPKKNIKYDELAKYPLTGGEIKNAIIIATIDAANSMKELTTEDFDSAAKLVIEERIVDVFLEEEVKHRVVRPIGFNSKRKGENLD